MEEDANDGGGGVRGREEMEIDWSESGKEEGLSSTFRIDREEVIRLIAQNLDLNGCKESAKCLERESGVLVMSKELQNLRRCVLEGDWAGLEGALHYVRTFKCEDDASDMCFPLYRQKFLEELESQRIKEAFTTLRTQVTKCCRSTEQLQNLSLLSICKTAGELRERANWHGVDSRIEALRSLQTFISPTILLPENRLHYLLKQALNYQKKVAGCTSLPSDRPLSLLEDITCPEKSPARERNDKTCDDFGPSPMKIDHVQENGNATAREEFEIDQKEVTRLIIQSLDSMGFAESARCVERESGTLALSDNVQKLRKCVFEGKWDELEGALKELGAFRTTDDATDAHYVLYKQKFLEYLENGNAEEALTSLRTKVAPCCRAPEQLQQLSLLTMCRTPDELKRRANWNGVDSRADVIIALQKYISPSILLPEKRLEYLLRQAIEYQLKLSQYPYSETDHISLLEDLKYVQDFIPKHTLQILKLHKDEVWFVQFSHNGKMLVSASRDKTVVIWSVDKLMQLEPMSDADSAIMHVLERHAESQAFLAWSPDDSHLLGCGNDKIVRLWNVLDGTCVRTFEDHTDTVTACAWLDDNRFVSASLDKQLLFWRKSEGEWRQASTIRIGARITDVAVSNDGKRLVMICSERKIHIYDAVVAKELITIQETATMTSLCLSADGSSLLVNLTVHCVPEIHEWDLKRPFLVRTYRGLHQSKYVIRSCFGGIKQFVVISGSEDNKVYIWHRRSGELLASLPGHRGTVNSVSWNPTDPSMLASASDDRTVRIWGQDRRNGRN